MPTFIRQATWIWPLAFAAILTFVGWQALSTLRVTMRDQVRSNLETTLHAAEASLHLWTDENLATVRVQAKNEEVVDSIRQLRAIARQSENPRAALLAAPALADLQDAIAVVAEYQGFRGWGVVDVTGMMLANRTPETIGFRWKMTVGLLGDGLTPETVITTKPIKWSSPDNPDVGIITMIVGAPILDETGQPIALLGFAYDPALEFSKILEVGRLGESGETYAFSDDGVMVSPSRFDDDLRSIGLLPEDPAVGSALTVEIRDPGGNLKTDYETDIIVKARPLTLMAASAISGEPGSNVDGYRDYRGVPVAGAWLWFSDLHIGLATEIDMEEAFEALSIVRRSFLTLIGLLVVAAGGMIVYSFVILRQQSALDEAEQLGRYRIERKLGAGGMGTVYLASHALLRRKTAIKVLKSEVAGDEGIKRFEREVQVSSSLSHPNTIEIYDYGTTPDGTFYYAMELLRGITIGQLVEIDGAQPEERVVYVMLQAAASLAEAHANGLIHRDLKPSNVMLCERGGLLDYVKVLDFGLVRSEEQSHDVALTSAASLTGTPLYMSPEAVESPEQITVRSDVYQLGAIAYYMLAGRHVFPGSSMVDVLAKHINDSPEPIEAVRGESVNGELEAIVLHCLAKNPEDRPANAGVLVDMLESCSVAGTWGQREARGWWAFWRQNHPDVLDQSMSDASLGSAPSAYQIDFRARAEAEKDG